jgi:hypothetical protein
MCFLFNDHSQSEVRAEDYVLHPKYTNHNHHFLNCGEHDNTIEEYTRTGIKLKETLEFRIQKLGAIFPQDNTKVSFCFSFDFCCFNICQTLLLNDRTIGSEDIGSHGKIGKIPMTY